MLLQKRMEEQTKTKNIKEEDTVTEDRVVAGEFGERVRVTVGEEVDGSESRGAESGGSLSMPIDAGTMVTGGSVTSQVQDGAPTTFVKVEKSLASLGFFTPSSKRIKQQKVKQIRFIRDVDGKRVEVSGEIFPSAHFGLPITADQDKYLALQEIITDIFRSKGKVENPIKFRSADLLRLLGRDRNAGKNYNEIGEWLDVMSATMIKSNGVVYNAGQKRFAIDRFHVFDRAVSVGKELDDGTIADANYVWLSKWQLENINNKFLLPIDLATYREMKNHIAKTLVLLLQIWLFASQKPFEKRYDELCEFLSLQTYSSLSQIQRQLKPSLDELMRYGYLERWQIAKTVDRKAYKIIFFHGKKFHSDRKQRLKQKTEVEDSVVVAQSDPLEPAMPEPGKLPAPERAHATVRKGEAGGDGERADVSDALAAGTESDGRDVVAAVGTPALVDELAARGIVPSVAMKLLEEIPADQHDQVRDYIEYWDEATGVGPGFLHDLVKNRSPLPPTFVPKRVREARKREAERSAQREVIAGLLKTRYDNYRSSTIEQFIAALPVGEFENRVTERIQVLSANQAQDGGEWMSSPALIEQIARSTVRAEIAAGASVLPFEDFRTRELPGILAELRVDPADAGIDLAA